MQSRNHPVAVLTVFKTTFLVFIVFFGFGIGTSQAQTTIRDQVLIEPFNVDSAYTLNDWILPETIKVFAEDTLINQSHWKFDIDLRLWSVKERFHLLYKTTQSIRVEFESYPYVVKRTYQNRIPQRLDSSFFQTNRDSLGRELIQRSSQNVLDDSELEQRGSLSRGIIIGTNQDFALESGLQFELSGKLTDDVSINALLTDKSIPIQPDGTTQNIREFDRVFIQLTSPTTTIEMGDVDVSLEKSTFAQINRRLQGATGYTSTKYGEYSGALSSVRGTFKSLSYEGEDGVQGPYRLTGRDGEEFVTILAGTERVFINGTQVSRGQENDYIIDYGLGEVFFTNNLLIKDETRIVIEYEYIDQNFSRTLVAAEAGDTFLDGRIQFGATVIRQADGDELLSQQSLSKEDIDVLRTVGDNPDMAIVPGERLVTSDDGINVRYAKVDTVFNGVSYSIFKNIPGDPMSQFIVSFSKAETGSGSYRRISSSVNGLLYEWAGPGLGEYEPFRTLPAPEKQQMVAFYGNIDITRSLSFFGEWAASGHDKNRFSSIDDDDNNDISYISGVGVKEVDSGIGTINASFKRRYSGERFSFFERTREVEFARKWNLQENSETKEAISEAELSLDFSSNSKIKSEFGIIEQDLFKGTRLGFSFVSDEPKVLGLNYTQDWVRSDDELLNEQGNWFRQKGNIDKGIRKNFIPYVGFEQEHREQRFSDTDSLKNTSFSFFEVGPGLRYSSFVLTADVGTVVREDKGVLENALEKESRSLEQRLGLEFRPSQFFSTKSNIHVRNKDFEQAFKEQGNANSRGLLIRSATNYKLSSGVFNGDAFYEANTQRRALFQEAYIEVGPELGQHVWIDSNKDGVQQIDEFFFELSPNEGTYVKRFLPSDELFPVIDLKARLRNEVKPFAFLKSEDIILKNIILRSRIDISENSTTGRIKDVYLLKLSTFRNDSTTIEGRLSWDKELDLLPEYSKGDVRIGYNQSSSTSKRSNESQKSFSNAGYFNGSVNLTAKTRISTDVLMSKNEISSDQLSSRNFDIKTFEITPNIEILANRSWQSSLSLSYSKKEDRAPQQPVEAQIWKFTSTNRTFLFKKIQANTRIELRNSAVKGTSTSAGAYELTEGTGEGTNLIWTIAANYRLSHLIRFSFSYDGRTVKDRPDIHTTKMVISAVF